MPNDSFPFFQFEGSPFEVGRQHGRALGDRIQTSIEVYTEQFATRSQLEWSQVLRFADDVLVHLVRLAPDLVDEMDGIAAGAEQPRAAILALNARTMLLRVASPMSDGQPDDGECTTGALLPAATRNGHTYLFGNWDQDARCIDNAAFLELHVEGRPSIFVLTEAGILARTGFNEHGIGVTGNSLRSDIDTGAAEGVPWPIVRRRVLHHAALAPAIKEIFACHRTHSGNHLVAHSDGFVVDLEATPAGVFPLTPDGDLVTHANHFVTAEARSRLNDVQLGRSPSSLYRSARLHRALLARSGSIGLDDIQLALRDHFGYPQSVCAHPGPTATTTVSSHIADLTARTMTISSGPPCVHDYHTFRLSPSLPAVS